MIKKIILAVLLATASFTAMPICAMGDQGQQVEKKKKDEWEEPACLALASVAGAAAFLSLATLESAQSGGITAGLGAIMIAASQKVTGSFQLIGSVAGLFLAGLGGAKYKMLA